MRISEIDDSRVVLVLGGPRSGTSWLGKIFDSHPDVLYRHEPDTVRRFPHASCVERADLTETQEYLRGLFAVNTLKPAGSLPRFPKSYHGLAARVFRPSVIYGLRLLEQIPSLRARAFATPIPDMIRAGQDRLTLVVKSVSARQMAGLFARTLPRAKIIFIVRDPCGQIASMMRGAALGKFGDLPVDEVFGTEQAERYGLTRERIRRLPEVEQYAWHWVIMNELAVAGLEAAGCSKIVKYQDLCGDPVGVSRSLFAYAGLSWHPQTVEFLARSTRASGPDRYYQVFKNPGQSLNKWRSQLASDDQRRIIEVARRSPLWSLCTEYYA